MRAFVCFVVVASVLSCSQPYNSRHWPRSREARPQVVYDVDADFSASSSFYAAPFPSDARVLDDGAPDMRGLPNPFGIPFVEKSKQAIMAGVAVNGRGFSPLPVVSFAFDRPVPALRVLPLSTTKSTSGVQLVDLTPGRIGKRVAAELHVVVQGDSVRPTGLVQVAPLTGLSLLPGTWAAILKVDVDGDGAADLARSPVVDQLLRGMHKNAKWQKALQPLVDHVGEAGVAVDDVAAATVFTVSAPEAVLSERLRALRDGPAPAFKELKRGRDDVSAKQSYVELTGIVEQKQHQVGDPPHLFDNGTLAFSDKGELLVTRTEDADFVLTVPKGKMPKKGFPVLLYVHGTGGNAIQVIDRSRRPRPAVAGPVGEGMASWVAPKGVATASVSGPYSPNRIAERALDGYGAYVFTNPAAMRDNFAQMLIEHVRFLRLLDELEIDASLLPEVDAGGAKVRFDTDTLVIAGHSLGSYLTGMLAGSLDGVDGAVLSGAGGTWVEFAFGPKDPIDLQGVIETLSLPPGEDFDRFHPFIDAFEFAAGAADNTFYTRHILKHPWPGHSAPHVLVVEGEPDAQVPTGLQRALVRSVGVDFAGTDVGTRSINRLLPGLHAIGKGALHGAVAGNVDVGGEAKTGVVVRYAEDGFLDGHSVLFQRDDARKVFVDFVSAVVAGEVPVVDP